MSEIAYQVVTKLVAIAFLMSESEGAMCDEDLMESEVGR